MKAYQCKVMIKGSHPPIWRRCIIPAGLTFSQLSVVLNLIMGWRGSHLSQIEFKKQDLCFWDNAYDTDDPYWNTPFHSASNSRIDTYVEYESWFTYVYDMGDDWEHKVTVEKIIPDYDKSYPVVLKFKGNCPPEDCGGIGAYQAENPAKNTIDYDLAKVNAVLAKTCMVLPKKADLRNAQKIYADLEQGIYGLPTKQTKERERTEKLSEKQLEGNYQEQDINIAMKDFAKMLSQKIKDYQKKIVAMPQEYTLEQSLNFFDKASLRNIAEDKKIPYRTNDTKASLVKKIHSYIAKPKVIEAYFLHMEDDEIKALKKAVHSRDAARQMTENDFPSLSLGIYANYTEQRGINIPTEVKEAFLHIDKEEFRKKRKRRLWLLQCLNAANLMYGIAPIDSLVKMFNRHKKYTTTAKDLLWELQSMPADLMSGELHGETYYFAGLWPDDHGLWETQGDTPFYIPSVQEVQDLYDDLLTGATNPQQLMDFFLNHAGDLEDEMLYQALLGTHLLLVNDVPIPAIIQEMKLEGLDLTDQEERILLPKLLADYAYHTRKVDLRGFKPCDLEKHKPTDNRSNLIEVKNWRKGY